MPSRGKARGRMVNIDRDDDDEAVGAIVDCAAKIEGSDGERDGGEVHVGMEIKVGLRSLRDSAFDVELSSHVKLRELV